MTALSVDPITHNGPAPVSLPSLYCRAPIPSANFAYWSNSPMTKPWSRSAAFDVIVAARGELQVTLRQSAESASGPRLLFEPTSCTPQRTQQKEV